MQIDDESGVFACTPPEQGVYPVMLGVIDPKGAYDIQTFWLTAYESHGQNEAPEILNAPRASVQYGQAFSFSPIGFDADSDPFTVTLHETNHPAGMTQGTDGIITWTPDAADVNITTAYLYDVTISDGTDSVPTYHYRLYVLPEMNNSPPEMAGYVPRSTRG